MRLEDDLRFHSDVSHADWVLLVRCTMYIAAGFRGGERWLGAGLANGDSVARLLDRFASCQQTVAVSRAVPERRTLSNRRSWQWLSNRPRIQSLARASAIMDVIASGDETGVGLSEISGATSLNKTTAFNLIGTLVVLGFVEQDEQSRRYRLGLRNLELGRIVQQRLRISHLARPILADLCRKANETVNLGLPDLYDLVVVDSFQGSRILHATTYAGWRSPYHCTALGKAIMSQWDAPMRRTVYSASGLPRKTPPIRSRMSTRWKRSSRAFRVQGYALDLEENDVGCEWHRHLDHRWPGGGRGGDQRGRAVESADERCDGASCRGRGRGGEGDHRGVGWRRHLGCARKAGSDR